MNEDKEEKITSDDEKSYIQTHKSLTEALAERSVLREKLHSIEKRNKPAKYGKPVKLRSLESIRGIHNIFEIAPDRLPGELASAQMLLTNSRRTVDSLTHEKNNLAIEINKVRNYMTTEVENMLLESMMKKRKEISNSQQAFQVLINDWSKEKSQLLSNAEQSSIKSHDALHKASLSKEKVETQRLHISKLVTELRKELSRSKEIREKLDDAKNKVSLIDSLVLEIDTNKKKANDILGQIEEQKSLLRAKKLSEPAKKMIEQQESQILELEDAKKDSQLKLESASNEMTKLVNQERHIISRLRNTEEEFKNTQSQVMILESDITILNAELKRSQETMKSEAQKNTELQRALKESKLEAAQVFLSKNVKSIHKPESVKSALNSTIEQFRGRPTTAISSPKNKINKPGANLNSRPHTSLKSSRRQKSEPGLL